MITFALVGEVCVCVCMTRAPIINKLINFQITTNSMTNHVADTHMK